MTVSFVAQLAVAQHEGLPANSVNFQEPSAEDELSPGAPSQDGRFHNSSTEEPSQAQLDREWLTAYMMSENGYRLDHLPALDDAFTKMTPTQLSTLRKLSEEKYRAMLEQQALFRRAQQLQLSIAEARQQQQPMLPESIRAGRRQAATLADQRLRQMREQAAAAAIQNTQAYPGPYGAYPTTAYIYFDGNPYFIDPALLPFIP